MDTYPAGGRQGRRGAERREGRVGGCSRQKSTCQQTVQARYTVASHRVLQSHGRSGAGGIEERLPQEGTPKPSLEGHSVSVKEVKEDTAVCAKAQETASRDGSESHRVMTASHVGAAMHVE